MRTILSVTLLFISAWVNGQIKTQPMASTNLPKNIRYQGKPVQLIKYQDNTGSYLAITTQTGTQPQKGDDEFKQAHLYGYVYQLKDGGSPVLLWQLHDMVTDCNLDMVANFIPGSLTIIDLDKNGKAEVWVAYRLSCRGDVSPSELKIIMHEGTTKYAKRGIGKIKVGNAIQHDGGVITSDEFKKAPVSFKVYAGKLWDKYVLETM
ncbi:M949_RS01915 family surface polysaccharide biosynthesis protein [Mucilaginibacter terrae]|uniref:M949_RS01915 family surface polysaccharide biosynthesis protein n=1 Tax=Mucilaginibacter terrae TaxID=1955052 RepID=UPI00362C2C93